MNKSYLIDTIRKQHLGALSEKTKITIKDNTLFIKFVTDKKNIVGTIVAPNFELIDCEFGVYNTSQLIKLIKIIEHDVKIDINIIKKVPTKLLVADKEYNLEYSLADIALIPQVPKPNEPEYTLVADIDAEFINKFIRAEKAIDTEIFNIVPKALNQELEFMLGNNEIYSNKIQFSIPSKSISTVANAPIKFPIEEFREILSANQDMVKGSLHVHEDGLLKIEFENETNVQTSYLLVGIN